jgi:hypothetical protein
MTHRRVTVKTVFHNGRVQRSRDGTQREYGHTHTQGKSKNSPARPQRCEEARRTGNWIEVVSRVCFVIVVADHLLRAQRRYMQQVHAKVHAHAGLRIACAHQLYKHVGIRHSSTAAALSHQSRFGIFPSIDKILWNFAVGRNRWSTMPSSASASSTRGSFCARLRICIARSYLRVATTGS